MAVKTKIQQALGLSGPFINVFPSPIIAERAPASTDDQVPLGQVWIDTSVSEPFDIYQYAGDGNWELGGVDMATTTTPGIVTLTDNSDPVATKVYADNLAIAGSPVSTETTAGIGQLATDAEAIARTASTGALALFLTPTNLDPVLASPSAIGSTTPSTGAFTTLTATAVGAGISLTSDTDSSLGVTDPGVDLTLSSSGGRVVVNGEEAAADAVRILSTAGGLDVDVALLASITSSRNNAQAILIEASAGGIDILATGAATEDIDIVNTGGSVNISATESAADSIKIESTQGGIDILASGAAAGEDIDIIATGSSVNITSTENNAGAIVVRANGGASERITLLSSQGTGVDSINLESAAGGITLAAALASADAINLSASAGGVDIDGALQVNIASSQNAVDAIRIISSAGGIDIDAVGAATEDINITNTGGSVVIQATESVSDAIRMNASGVAGGFDIDSGTNGFIVDTTGAISLDSAAASNFTVTGAFDLTLNSTAGSVNLTAGESAADSMVLTSNGLDIVVSGAAGRDIDITNTGGSINITATENISSALVINCAGAASGASIDAGTAGLTIGTGLVLAVTSVATAETPYAVLGTDHVISTDSSGGALEITLPAEPATGRMLVVYDGTGQAAIGGNVTINGNGKNIAAAGTLEATKLINTAYESYNLYYNGTIWLGQNVV